MKEAQQPLMNKPRTIISGDQAVFSQWDSLIKLPGLRLNHHADSRIVHLLHLGDGIGRSADLDTPGVSITNEFYRPYINSGGQPDQVAPWFAVLDIMPLFTKELASTSRLEKHVGAIKFDTIAEKAVQAISVLDPETYQRASRIVANMGLGTLPETKEALYRQITQSDWWGAVDNSGRSASSLRYVEIAEANTALMKKLAVHIIRSTPPERREQVKQRIRTVIGKEGVFAQAMKVGEDALLTDIAEKSFQIVTEYMNDLSKHDTDFTSIELSESTKFFEIPKEGEVEAERFNFFNWYFAGKNREVYDQAHNESAQILKKQNKNPIRPLAANETPFWLIQNGLRSKLTVTNNEGTSTFSFDGGSFTLDTDQVSVDTVKSQLAEHFPNDNFSILPTAIGLVIQLRSNGDIVLPEKGSSYIDQANLTWSSIVKNSTAEAIAPILQGDVLRVSPNAIAAFPRGVRIKLQPYLQADFPVDAQGYTTTDSIIDSWRDVVEKKRETLKKIAEASDLMQTVEAAFSDSSDLESVRVLVNEFTTLTSDRAELDQMRKGIMTQLKERIQKMMEEIKNKNAENQGKDKGQKLNGPKSMDPARLGELTKYFDGQLPNMPEFDDEQLKEIMKDNEEVAKRVRVLTLESEPKDARRAALEGLLQYLALCRTRDIESGADALEYYNDRPSLATLYLMFGDDFLHNLWSNMANSQTHVYSEETEPQPILESESYDAEGNRLVIVEDKTGWFGRDHRNTSIELARIRQRIIDQQLDSAILLTRDPDDASKEVVVRILEKDGSESEMCGNGLRAVAKFMHDRYGKSEFQGRSRSGEFVYSRVNQEDGRCEAYAGPIREVENATTIKQAVVQVIGETDSYLTLAQVAGEPHIVLQTHTSDFMILQKTVDAIRSLQDEGGNLLFPQGINISFVRSEDNGVCLTTHERGVESFTGSCGTAALCAGSALLEDNGTIRFTTPKGSLQVTRSSSDELTISGSVHSLAA